LVQQLGLNIKISFCPIREREREGLNITQNDSMDLVLGLFFSLPLSLSISHGSD
jgi:hypothetical protein